MNCSVAYYYYYFLVIILVISKSVNGQPVVPALFIFGDSIVDVGNNNNLHTIVKSNFNPYGRDFLYHQPTGRFCNGKLATDFTGIRFSLFLPLILFLYYFSIMNMSCRLSFLPRA